MAEPYGTFMQRETQRFARLDITLDHVTVVATLPLHHRDPFDRLLVAQAMVEQVPIISGDPKLDQYLVTRMRFVPSSLHQVISLTISSLR